MNQPPSISQEALYALVRQNQIIKGAKIPWSQTQADLKAVELAQSADKIDEVTQIINQRTVEACDIDPAWIDSNLFRDITWIDLATGRSGIETYHQKNKRQETKRQDGDADIAAFRQSINKASAALSIVGNIKAAYPLGVTGYWFDVHALSNGDDPSILLQIFKDDPKQKNGTLIIHACISSSMHTHQLANKVLTSPLPPNMLQRLPVINFSDVRVLLLAQMHHAYQLDRSKDWISLVKDFAWAWMLARKTDFNAPPQSLVPRVMQLQYMFQSYIDELAENQKPAPDPASSESKRKAFDPDYFDFDGP